MCSSLKNITLPEGIKSIDYYTFSSCCRLRSITLPQGVTSIGDYAFKECNKLSSVIIPQRVTSIKQYTFYNCSSLTSITIPNSVTSIGSSAFKGCYRLVEVINKSSLNIKKGSNDFGEVGYYAFAVKNSGESSIVNKDGCLFYTYDNINYLVGYIGNETSLVLPNDYNGESYVINNYAFYNCRNIASITIPNSVTSIGELAFYNCERLIEVINKSSLNINKGGYDYGWVGCYALEIKNSGESSIVNKDGYIFYTVDNINYLVGYTGNETSLVLPDNYNGESYVINDYAFYDYDSIISITISNSVTNMGHSVFRGCNNLTSVTLPEGITSINYKAFSECRSLTRITIPDSVTSIGQSAFYYCYNLTDVYYKGTESEWTNISVSDNNDYLANATKHYNSQN